MYSQILCGLIYREEVLRCGAVFASALVRAMEGIWSSQLRDEVTWIQVAMIVVVYGSCSRSHLSIWPRRGWLKNRTSGHSIYTPHKDEVVDLIQKQGSFSLDLLDSYEVNWDPYDTDYVSVKVSDDQPIHGEIVAKILRAATEPMLIAHFGNSAMDLVFQNFEKKVNEHLVKKKTKHHVLVLCMTKKI